MTNHYQTVVDFWQKKALTFDWKEKYRDLGLWGYSPSANCKIHFFGKEYEICRETARIFDPENPERTLNFNTLMGIYHLFYYSRPGAKASGDWIPLREIRRAAPFEQAFLQNTLHPFAKVCSGHAEDLLHAGLSLGFRILPRGDVGLEADVFDCMKLRLHFWDADEEFPAQANILFDSHADRFLHEETVIMMGMEMTQRLLHAMEPELRD